jgi:hypothetical protein
MNRTFPRHSINLTTYIFLMGLQFVALNGRAQYYPQEPQPELAMGIKVVTGQFIYGKNHLYNTDPTSVALAPGFRYDHPIKLYTKRFVPHYIDLVSQAGFLYCKARVFDTAYTDPNTNGFVRERSYNTTYLPVYFGVYNMATISFGVEIFYWKGLGNRDIYGTKFLSLGYNARQFRLNVAGEFYAQVKNSKNNGTVFSIEFFWKLIKGD